MSWFTRILKYTKDQPRDGKGRWTDAEQRIATHGDASVYHHSEAQRLQQLGQQNDLPLADRRTYLVAAKTHAKAAKMHRSVLMMMRGGSGNIDLLSSKANRASKKLSKLVSE